MFTHSTFSQSDRESDSTSWVLIRGLEGKTFSRESSSAKMGLRWFLKLSVAWCHPHDSTLGESSREAQSGRRLLGTNAGGGDSEGLGTPHLVAQGG